MKSHWRNEASEIIYKIIKENPDKSNKELLKIISKAYPFGERNYHPYKIWLDTVHKAMEIREKMNFMMGYKKEIN